MKHLIVCAAVSLMLGCVNGTSPSNLEPQHGPFEIYFLKDSALTGYQASQVDINRLELREPPWLTNYGLELYDFSSHCLYLKEDKSRYFAGYRPDSGWRPILNARAFVVVANTRRCYVGSLHSAILSSMPWGPFVDESSVWFYPSDVLHIGRSWTDSNDVRNDTRIRDVLTSLGLYHGGISVQLQSIQIVRNSDTSTADYTFTVANRDCDNLYVLDPEKMGTAAFHYFTNGIVFRSSAGFVESTYKVTSPPAVKWDPGLYSEVPVNESIQRTVRLQGYPKIPAGTYSCSFTFANPAGTEKENRMFSDGRIWLGNVESSKIEVVVP